MSKEKKKRPLLEAENRLLLEAENRLLEAEKEYQRKYVNAQQSRADRLWRALELSLKCIDAHKASIKHRGGKPDEKYEASLRAVLKKEAN